MRTIVFLIAALSLAACAADGFDTHASMAYVNANAKKSTAIYKMQ